MTRTLMVVLLASLSACVFAQDNPLLFRASFDEALSAEVAGGNPEAVWTRGGTAIVADETRGSCARVPAGAQLLYDAPGNVYWERGTLSFWWLCEEPIGQTEFTVASLGSFDHFYYGRWLRLYALGGQLFMHIWDWHYDTTRLVVSSGAFLPQQGQWYHVALGWDAAEGFALYLDGERIGSSDRTFYMPLNINQIGLGVSAVASHARATSTRALRFDEARVYDRWLDDAQIAALAAGEDVREAPPLDEAAIAAHRIASLNLDDPGIWRPERGRTAYAAQPQIVTARDVLRTQMTGVDGKLATQWPSGRRYTQEGFRYDVEMAGEDFPVNYVSMIASHTGAVQIASGGETRTVMERTTQDPFVTRALLDEPIVAESAHITRVVNEEDSRHDGAMCDLQLLHIDDSAFSDDRHPEWLSPAADPEALGDQWRIIKGEYPPGDQTVLAPAETGEPVDLPAMRTVHIVSDPAPERTVVGVVRLRLFLEAPPDTVAHLELFHPLNYTRRQMMLDFVPNEGPVELLPRPLLLEPGQRLRLTLQFTRPVRLSASATFLPRDEEQDEYFADQMRMLKMYFMRLSEARPWGWDPTNIKLLREFCACLDQLRALRPDDERVAAYHHWTRAEEGKPRPELPATPEGVPEWAWYQVRLLELCKRVPAWWIENRQVENGEFGSNDGPNDDSVLVQDFAGLHLMDGPDEMLLESARKVGLMTWARTMEDGINRQVTDPLHAYEWGANVNNMLAVMDYGDPRWVERMMEIGQHYERLTGINAAGHRHYRSNRYGAGEIVTEGRYGWDQTSNALNMQAGALLGW